MGEEKLAKLAEVQSQQPLDLDLTNVYSRLAAILECDRRILQTAFFNALVPLNGLRRRLEMRSPDFLMSLDYTISERAPQEWKAKNLAPWAKMFSALAPFFEPDNFFAQVSKAFDLLSERPSVLQNVRILTEFRPIYNEALTESVAFLQTNTLVLDYWDGGDLTSLHLTLDNPDLDDLQGEMERARRKIKISRKEALEKNIHFVTYGESSET